MIYGQSRKMGQVEYVAQTKQVCPTNIFDLDDDEQATGYCVPVNEPSSTALSGVHPVVRCLWCRRPIMRHAMIPIDSNFGESKMSSGEK